jgi:hypothetical protein
MSDTTEYRLVARGTGNPVRYSVESENASFSVFVGGSQDYIVAQAPTEPEVSALMDQVLYWLPQLEGDLFIMSRTTSEWSDL